MMTDPSANPTEPRALPSKPAWAETKFRVFRQWFAVVGFNLGNWVLGFGFDVAPTGFFVNIGPLFAGFEQDEPPQINYDDLPDWSWTLHRFVIHKWKFETRLQLDLNIWKLGYMMADMHDHGLYVGPLNIQAEYDKMFDYPDVTIATVHRAFIEWLATARSRLKIAVEVRARTRRQIELSFVGINSAIGASVTARELRVFLEREGRIWDLLLSLHVWPRLATGGYICEHCKPEQRTTFPDLKALWRDHLFEPLLEWVNEKLAAADAVALYDSPSSAWAYAELLSTHDGQKPDPAFRIPLRVS